ncbi:MAG: hypothetical protein J0H15_13005 [Xanthomonadales bacterium]|nr:hypothetical protein [Xanthomonadales bacterium]
MFKLLNISFHAYGAQFGPSRVGYNFVHAIEPGTIAIRGKYKGQRMPYGHAEMSLPSQPDGERGIIAMCEHARKWLSSLKLAGATEFTLWVVREYHEQCNEELGHRELELLASLGCTLCYSAYQADTSD